jgi:hypothetical protein
VDYRGHDHDAGQGALDGFERGGPSGRTKSLAADGGLREHDMCAHEGPDRFPFGQSSSYYTIRDAQIHESDGADPPGLELVVVPSSTT